MYDYITHKTNHPDNTAHAGATILVSTKIRHYLLPSFQEHDIQATNIQINVNNIPINLSSIYCPPSHNINKDKFNSFFNSLSHVFIVGGDFNAKHNALGVLGRKSKR